MKLGTFEDGLLLNLLRVLAMTEEVIQLLLVLRSVKMVFVGVVGLQ